MDEITIKCNMRPEYEIPANQSMHYWLRVENILIDARDPQHPIHRFRLLCQNARDYEKYWSPKLKINKQLGYQQAAGFESMELIHNPELMKQKPKIELPVTAEQLHRQDRKPLTKSQVQKMLDEKK